MNFLIFPFDIFKLDLTKNLNEINKDVLTQKSYWKKTEINSKNDKVHSTNQVLKTTVNFTTTYKTAMIKIKLAKSKRDFQISKRKHPYHTIN